MEEERAHSNAAECPTFALRQRDLPAAARKFELPLSRFPLRGKAGAGGFPPGFPPRRVVMAASIWGIGRENLRMAATSALTFTTFS
jgi:hypothetical protein